MEILTSVSVRAKMMTLDELGNAYVVRQDNTVLRYNRHGDSTGFYQSVQNGEVGFVDVTNPLRMVIYYPAYSKLVVLDAMMTVKNELDLRKLNIPSVSAVASSADGNLWLFDQFNARLKKVNENLQVVAESNDLRQEFEALPAPVFMVEKEQKIFLSDPLKGIFIFDRYASYVNTISILGVKRLQVDGNKLFYRIDDTLYSWDMNLMAAKTIIIPGTKILDAAIADNILYVLYEQGLVMFRLEDE